MSKPLANKRRKTIDGFYMPIDDTIKTYSVNDPKLKAILQDADNSMIYSKPCNTTTKILKELKDELSKTVNGMKNTQDPKEILELGAKAERLEENREKMELEVNYKI